MPRETLTQVKTERDEAKEQWRIEREKRLRLEALVDMLASLILRERGINA